MYGTLIILAFIVGGLITYFRDRSLREQGLFVPKQKEVHFYMMRNYDKDTK